MICVLGSAVLCAAASGITADGPYAAIVDRNVFGLKPPPPPPDPNEAAKAAPTDLTLTGITTILGNKRVLLKSAPKPGKPGEKPTERSYILTEGQRDGDVEILTIDEKAGAVKLRLAGNEMTLDFEKNGPKLPTTPPPAAVPGLPIPGGRQIPIPGAAPATLPMPIPGTTPQGFPTRTLRLPGAGTVGTPGAGAATATPASYSGGLALGGYGYGTTAAATPQKEAIQQPQFSAEEQEVIIEAQREHLKSQGNPVASLLPPTRISLPGTTQQSTAGQTTTTPQLPPVPGAPPGFLFPGGSSSR